MNCGNTWLFLLLSVCSCSEILGFATGPSWVEISGFLDNCVTADDGMVFFC